MWNENMKTNFNMNYEGIYISTWALMKGYDKKDEWCK